MNHYQCVCVLDRYALYVVDNADMERIWNPNQTVAIENGTVYFHFNQKLCRTEIDTLLPMLPNQTGFDNKEVSKESNGNKGACE